jgi:hypothetical protein
VASGNRRGHWVLVFIWGLLTYVIRNKLRVAFEQPNRDFAELRDKTVGKIGTDVSYLRKDVDKLLDQQAAQTLRGPVKAGEAQRAEEVEDAATRARDRHIIVDPGFIQSTAAPMLKSENSANWGATTALLNLRSFVNSTIPEASAGFNVGRVIRPEDHGKWFGNSSSTPDAGSFADSLFVLQLT